MVSTLSNAFYLKRRDEAKLGAGKLILKNADGKLETFIIEHPLKEGGFGCTYYAHRANERARLVIKELFPNDKNIIRREDGALDFDSGFSGSPADRWKPYEEVFQQEYQIAQAAAEILADDGGIYRAGDIFSSRKYTGQNGGQYLVMETGLGVSLDDILDNGWTKQYRQEKQPNANLPLIIPCLKAICGSLRRLHNRGILHLDIHPGNVFIQESNPWNCHPVLIDFGNAIDATNGGIPLSKPYSVTDFSGPELWALSEFSGNLSAGYSPSPHTDTYSVCAILFYACTTLYPRHTIYDKKTWIGLLRVHFPSNVYPGVAEQLITIFTKGILAPQWDRYTAGELENDLNKLEKLLKASGNPANLNPARLAAVQLLEEYPVERNLSPDETARLLFVGMGELSREVLNLVRQKSSMAMDISVIGLDANDLLRTELEDSDQIHFNFFGMTSPHVIVDMFSDYGFVFCETSETTEENRSFAEKMLSSWSAKSCPETIHYAISPADRDSMTMSNPIRSRLGIKKDRLNPVGSVSWLFLKKVELAEQLVKSVNRENKQAQADDIPAPAQKNKPWETIPDVRNYVSRHSEEKRIREALSAGNIAVLYSQTGMGKSSIAAHIAHQVSHNVVWINAETPDSTLKSLGCPVQEKTNRLDILSRTLCDIIKDDNRTLIVFDNLGYDRTADSDSTLYAGFMNELCQILETLNKDECIDIIVTTRQRRTAMVSTDMILVGDLSEKQALEYFATDFPYEFDANAAAALIKKFGLERNGRFSIPAIQSVAIKNIAQEQHGYQWVSTVGGTDLGELVRLQMDAIKKDPHKGEIFVSLLEIASFLDTSIPIELLFRIYQETNKGDTDNEDLLSIVGYYDSHITLLNYLDSDRRILTIHRAFQREINHLTSKRSALISGIIKVFLDEIHPSSYYGSTTVSGSKGWMQHALIFFETAKSTETNGRQFRRLCRILAWYYGEIVQDYEVSSRIYAHFLLQRNDVDGIMGEIDRLFLDVNRGIRFPLDTDRDIKRLYRAINRLSDDNPERQRIVQSLLLIRYHLMRANADFMHASLRDITSHCDDGLQLCRKLCSEYETPPYKMPMTEEEHLFCLEHMVRFYCRVGAAKRKKARLYNNSLIDLQNALDVLEGDEYNDCLDSLNWDENASYLFGFTNNLVGVTYTEGAESLENGSPLDWLFLAEKLNHNARIEYEKLQYIPGIFNQTANEINIFKDQARVVIDAVNKYIRQGGEPASPEAWSVCYASQETVPGLFDEHGNTKTISQWVIFHLERIEMAKKAREDYWDEAIKLHIPVERAVYSYLFPLAAAATHYNAYTSEEKRTLLLHALSHTNNFGEADGLEAALTLPDDDGDQTALLYRYHGDLCTKLAGFSNNLEERTHFLAKAQQSLDAARKKAEEIENQKAVEQVDILLKKRDNLQ